MPDIVNYQGDVLTDEMRNYLFGDPLSQSFGGGTGLGTQPSVSKDRAKEILSNWMFGIRPKPIDPSEILSKESSLSGVKQTAAAGMGLGGLFGFGKFFSSPLPPLDMGPMSSGVPYTVPPLPKLKPIWGTP